jgi:sigma-B regulation protein RsbU (phosphoserine phosphatase)
MATGVGPGIFFRDQLLDRRHRLETAVATLSGGENEVARLLAEVDAALDRLSAGSFGLCEVCGDTVEAERLLADPLTRFCLDHLTSREQRALEEDLQLASRIQRELLPRTNVPLDGWEIAYHYQPAGPVSGDYCDLIHGDGSSTYFLVGDVAGHGVAAALLMSQLSATLRTLASVGLPLNQLMERASRLFCESTLPTQYATLVCLRAMASGEIEICNAGHPPPLLLRAGGIERLGATGLPIGMFCSESFSSEVVRFASGDTLLLYTDGLLEAQNASGADYGIDRLLGLMTGTALSPSATVAHCLKDLISFRGPVTPADDLTIMAVRRTEEVRT